MKVCPGGMDNSTSLGKHEIVIKMLVDQKKSGRFYTAICAAPALVFEVQIFNLYKFMLILYS